MSSGTSSHVKLCAYTGENFYYQICDSANIVKTCPEIRRHYEGELKHLMLLPLCHVFGFIAVYLWFGFFSRTFVFPRDLNPATIQRTVKKHKVTHIFAVPMVWEAVAKAAFNKIKSRGDRTLHRFLRGLNFVNAMGSKGEFWAKRLMGEVREGLFGDSILFLITGGSDISSNTLRFFNGIGYHLANGYGMTEIGITSVEKSSSNKIRNSGSIGAPFGYTEYSLDEEGRLLVRGKTRASRILCDGKETISDLDEWFCTGDMMRCEKGRYFAQGRVDDLIVCDDGENLNPALAEKALMTEGIAKLCVYADSTEGPTLIVSVPGCYAKDRLTAIYTTLRQAMVRAKLDKVIRHLYFTHESLLAPGDFKLSRKKIAARVRDGQIRVFDPSQIDKRLDELFEGLEQDLLECFAEALSKDPSQITKDSHFFRDLGGTSLDYFALLGLLKAKLGVEIINSDTLQLATISEFTAYLKGR
jgi:long-chain acyl-CoA synthetase